MPVQPILTLFYSYLFIGVCLYLLMDFFYSREDLPPELDSLKEVWKTHKMSMLMYLLSAWPMLILKAVFGSKR